MKKKLICVLTSLMIISSCNVAFATDITKTTNHELKQTESYSDNVKNIEQARKNKVINEKLRDEYYSKYKDYLIDLHNVGDIKDSQMNEFQKKFFNTEDPLKKRVRRSALSKSRKVASNIKFSNFKNGSIIAVRKDFCAYGYWNHIGTYNQSKGKFITAQISNSGYGKGVIYEPPSWYRNNYIGALRLEAKFCNNSKKKSEMMNWLNGFLGRPYNLATSLKLRNLDSWTCVLLPYKGYLQYFDCCIAHNCLKFMVPDDMVYDRNIAIEDSWH